MDKVIASLTMTLLVIFPLIRFYQRSNWKRNTIWIMVILLAFIWFGTYALLQELSHMLGTFIAGGTINDFQLIPRFWKGDFRTAYIITDDQTSIQDFVTRLSPYIRDFVFLIIGYIILKKPGIKNSFIIGLILIMFLLGSMFDIVTNFLGYAIEKEGDFNGLAEMIGSIPVFTIAVSISLTGAFLTYKIFQIYRDFPKKSEV